MEFENTAFISGDRNASENRADTSCGIGNWYPKCLQRFAHPRFFLIFFSLISILQGAYFTYFIGILSTLEKRYSFDSWITGILLIADNLSPAFFGIFVGYFGKTLHKPRLVTFGMMITVLGCFLSSLPYFLFGSSIKSHRSTKINYLCNEHTKEDKCSHLVHNIIAIVILFLANFLNGFGSMAYYTVGTPYMDDNVKGKNSPFYLGITFSLRIIGPTLGFLLSSFCLKYYEDPMMNPGFDNSDPKWVGAWWIGFLVLGLAIFLVSFPLALFPKHLAVHDEMITEEEINISKNSFYELLPALKKLMKNPILMFHTMSITFQINGLFGYLVFMPKYIESQYRKTASSASFFSGNVTLAAMVIGVFLSGFCIHKLKPKARSLVGYMLFVELCAAVALLSAFFTGCESPSLQEHTASLLSVEPKACNSNCTCDSHIFSPICDVNNQMHFSPCSAGCYSSSKSGNGKMIFHNCSCILPSVEDLKYSALKGFCPQECSMFVAYIAIITVAKMLSATVRVGNVLINLRCVDEQDKTLALGAVEVVISVFATIPFPLFYGYIINKACILWDKSCEYQGNCWLYDNTLFRNYLHSVAVGFMFLAICCDSVVFVMSPRMRDLYGENKKPAANIELTATDS